MSTVVLIPAYNPDEKLVELAAELSSRSFQVLIVNDGSKTHALRIFDQCREFATIIGYKNNKGKGAALKHGMKYIRKNMPEADYFITADADGQHSVTDICRISAELEAGKDFILSVRKIDRNAPRLSRIGNYLSRFVYTLANAHYLQDNQSGLRGFDVRHIGWMLKVSGTRYDYEMNVLLYAEKQGIRIKKLEIETIYFDNNKGSSFKPLQDTARIYKRFFTTNLFWLISTCVSLVLVLISTCIFGYNWLIWTLMLCWGIQAALCFVVERYVLFNDIDYTPGARRLIISIFKTTIYICTCFGLSFTPVPPFLAYILVWMIVGFGEYYLLKVTAD